MAVMTIFTTNMNGKQYTEIDADDHLTVGDGLAMVGNALLLLLQSVPNKKDRKKTVRRLFLEIYKATRRLNRIG